MRKIVLFGVLSLAIAMVTPSLAGADDVNGPQCADIIGQSSTGASSGGSYGSTGIVTIRVALAAPACSYIDYSVSVLTAEGAQALPLVLTNDAGDLLFFQGTVNPDTNPFVCVYGTTSVGSGHHVFDSAPNAASPSADCSIAGAPPSITLAKSSSPGFGGFD